MHVRDASGRRVSLLNDDVATASQPPALYPIGGAYAVLSYYARGTRTSSTPTTPDLLRSNSYDSQTSAEPVSPLTPLHDLGRYVATAADARSRYDEYYAGRKRRSGAPSDGRSVSYEDDSAGATTSSERPAKRFPCRFRDSHGCEKTFTTSGHASRHSKIHTAEKAVPCSFAGCTKKFTRADNMKQHLETHYKDKSRPSSSRPSLSSSERRSSTSGRSKMTVPVANGSATANSTPLPSPGGAWDLRDLGPPLLGRPSIVHSPASGLDALALAVECQEGA